MIFKWRGELLRYRRKCLGLTTDELARKIGTQHNHITMWEKGPNEPTGHYLVALCEALKIEPKSLYDRVQSEGNLNETIRAQDTNQN